MTFSFTLVIGLFLLAPDFAVFAGLYHGSQLGPVRSPPPPPGSILALTIVALGALVCHFLAASVFLVQDLACAKVARCLEVDFDPNAYTALFRLAEARPIGSVEIVEVLGCLIAVSLLAYFSVQFMVGRRPVADALKPVLYGWLSDVVVASNQDEAVLAYVLSDVEEDGTIVGYEGVVANMTTTGDKEVSSILLSGCETFYLRVTARGVQRRKAERTEPIPQLYLDRARIKNIAFERVRFKDQP